ALSDAHDLRDLAVVQTLHALQHERRALLGRQRREPLVELAERDARLGEGRAVPARLGLHVVARFVATRATALGVDRAVDDDAIQPSGRAGAAIEVACSERAISLHVRFLHYV